MGLTHCTFSECDLTLYSFTDFSQTGSELLHSDKNVAKHIYAAKATVSLLFLLLKICQAKNVVKEMSRHAVDVLIHQAVICANNTMY